MTMKEIAKKIIASINPGSADISEIGDGTIKGAIKELNSKLATQIVGKSDLYTIVKLLRASQYVVLHGWAHCTYASEWCCYADVSFGDACFSDSDYAVIVTPEASGVVPGLSGNFSNKRNDGVAIRVESANGLFVEGDAVEAYFLIIGKC